MNITTKMNRAVFVDLDGTIVKGRESQPSEEDIIALKDIQKRGHFLVICTGRSKMDLLETYGHIRFNHFADWVIYSSGAVIENLKTGEVLSKIPMSSSEANTLLNYVKMLDGIIKLAEDRDLYTDRDTLKWNIIKKTKKLENKPLDKMIVTREGRNKIGIFVYTSKHKTRLLYEELLKKFPDTNFSITGSRLFIEATDKRVTKGLAIDILAKHLNIDLKKSIAIGDSLNDASMLKVVGLPIMMKNGFFELEEIAKIKTSFTHKKSGASKALKVIWEEEEKYFDN